MESEHDNILYWMFMESEHDNIYRMFMESEHDNVGCSWSLNLFINYVQQKVVVPYPPKGHLTTSKGSL